MKNMYLLYTTETRDLTVEQTEHPKKHRRGSSPQDGVEQIYHDRLKRARSTKETQENLERKDQEKQTPKVGFDSESRSDDEGRWQASPTESFWRDDGGESG